MQNLYPNVDCTKKGSRMKEKYAEFVMCVKKYIKVYIEVNEPSFPPLTYGPQETLIGNNVLAIFCECSD